MTRSPDALLKARGFGTLVPALSMSGTLELTRRTSCAFVLTFSIALVGVVRCRLRRGVLVGRA